jgi:hypothetical protein
VEHSALTVVILRGAGGSGPNVVVVESTHPVLTIDGEHGRLWAVLAELCAIIVVTGGTRSLRRKPSVGCKSASR